MNVIRIPKTYEKRLNRLTEKQQAFILMSLIKLINNKDVVLPDNHCGDTLESIWADCLRMEKKNTKASDIEVGGLVGSMPGVIVYDSIEQDSIANPPIKRDKFIPPTQDEVEGWCKNSGHKLDAVRIFKYYDDADWKDARGTQVKNWKQKIRGVWCKDENKILSTSEMSDEDKIRDFKVLSIGEFRKKYGIKEQIRIGDIVGE